MCAQKYNELNFELGFELLCLLFNDCSLEMIVIIAITPESQVVVYYEGESESQLNTYQESEETTSCARASESAEAIIRSKEISKMVLRRSKTAEENHAKNTSE